MLRNLPFRSLAVWASLALLIVLAVVAPGTAADGGQGQDQTIYLPENWELKYPNLGSHLDQLVAQVEDGKVSEGDAAKQASIHQETSVAVTVHLTSNVDEVVEFLAINGGDPRNVGEDYIEGYVPVALLGNLSEHSGVVRVREIVPPQPALGPITSQGVQAHAAPAWHQAGTTGKGIKVGVIDTGFEGFRGLLGTELPATVVARCYTDIGIYSEDLDDCENEDVHGTAVAEAVMDIAPEVSLYIANPGSWADLQATADWMVSQGVTVINHSVAWIFDGPGDGTSPDSHSPTNTLERVIDDGVVWVNAAGNEARVTWFRDSPAIYNSSISGVDFVAFDGSDDITNGLRGLGGSVTIQLRWDDRWEGASSNLDLRLFDHTLQRYVAGSEDHQTGGSDHVPREVLDHRLVHDRLYGIVVIHRSGSVPEWVQASVFSGDVRSGRIEHYTEEGSIGSPAEANNPGLLAVGAAHHWDTHTIAAYSSRGPAPDGRTKPEIVGADCGATSSIEGLVLRSGHSCWFSGTSQAAPHVAGMVALVRQRFPDYSPVQVAEYLKGHAERRGNIPNDTWGYGFAQLPAHDAVAVAELPGAPRNLTATANGQTQIDLSWSEPASDGGAAITGYRIEVSNDGSSWGDLAANTGSTSTSYPHGGLTAGSTRHYRVSAINSEGTGPASNVVSATTDSASPTPTDPCVETLTADGTVSGQWATGCDSQVSARGYARYYTFELAAESEVTITLELTSGNADTFLYLRQGENAKAGSVLHENDDDGATTRSKIDETLAAGSYTIEATTFDTSQTGDFTLTISGWAAVAGLRRDQLPPIPAWKPSTPTARSPASGLQAATPKSPDGAMPATTPSPSLQNPR